MKVLVVGAGISGLTAAAAMHRKGYKVTVLESRDHLGGNCADKELDDGTRLHLYGPHIFHTDSIRVWFFLNYYTNINSYVHKVLADTALGLIPIPFNKVSEKKTGRLDSTKIRDLLFVDYSEKMWGRSWDDLPAIIKDRVPQKRNNHDCRYFTDISQGIPTPGYKEMFDCMADGCEVRLGVDTNAWRRETYDVMFYTGPLDAFYENKLGPLGYKTLDIETRPANGEDYFPAAVINQCNRRPYTRIADHSWWTGDEGQGKGMVTKEHPRDWQPDDIPYYPIPYGEDQDRANEYLSLRRPDNVFFIGRLATYKYLNMDLAMLHALEATEQFS